MSTTSPSFARQAKIRIVVLRPPAIGSGRRGTSSVHLSNIPAIPLSPVDAQTRERLVLETPFELLQTFVQGSPDVKKGDTLQLGSSTYPIRHVGQWSFGADTRLEIIVERLERSGNH
jgi:hypothetical protein